VINFRYHVVSLTAVFLALAIGLVVGTAALNGPVADSLNNRVNALTKQNQAYREQVSQLESEAGKQEQFANESAQFMLQNKLAGQRVLVLAMQQTKSSVDGVVHMLNLAGAKVTGQVEIEDKFTDPASNETLLDLAHSTPLPASITNTPLNSNGVETSSFLLASVLLDHNPAITPDAMKTVITAYKEANFIVPTGDLAGPAQAVVFVAAPPYTDREAGNKNTNVVTIADQFDKVGQFSKVPTVVAASRAAGAGNLVAAVRNDPAMSKTVSTVDNVDTPDGQIAAALALVEQLLTKKAGHYGLAGGATSMLPKSPSQ
jgi:hypothetical protein